MSRIMLVDAAHPEETRVVIADERSSILEFDFTTAAKPQIKGNVYLAKVTRVEPSLQAAFVEYGGGKQGFLPFSEIHPNYYQIPVSDRERLIAEEEESAAREAEEDDLDDDDNDDDSGSDPVTDLIAEDSEPDESVQSEVINEDGEEKKKPARRTRRAPVKKKTDDSAEAEEKPKRVRKSKKSETDAEADTESKTNSDNAEDEAAAKPKRARRSRVKKAEPEDKSDSDSASENIADEKSDDAKSSDSNDSDGENNETTTAADDDKPRRRRRRGGRGGRGGRDQNKDSDRESNSNSNSGRRRGGRKNKNDDDSDNDSGVETISSEDESERPQKRNRDYAKRYKIQEVIKRNQVLLVQVVKEERGNKGVSLTSFLSLAGRYCVLMPNSPRGGGISRKISKSEDRKRLKKVLKDMELPQGMNVIIRTAGASRTKVEIKRDFDYLVKLWNQIRDQTLSSTAPALVYEESNIIQRTIRDSYNSDIEEIIVDGEATHKETKAFMRMLIPSHAPRVKLHKSDVPLFHKYKIEDQLLSMQDPEVRLKSGGSIVMMPTEALISIDVNSGKSNRERNVEETAYKTNLEAAREVARQLRLRDLAGLIVIDFIDMMDGRNRRNVERTMKEALKNDKAKIQVGRISPFGLMEMSRQRMRPSISESINRSCPHCQGTGMIRSDATVAIQIIRSLEKEASLGDFERFRVAVTSSEALYVLNHMRAELQKVEDNFSCQIEITIDDTLHEGNFRIDKFKAGQSNNNSRNDNRKSRSESKTSSAESSQSNNDSNTQNDGDEERKPRKRKRGGRGRNRRDRDNNNEANGENSTDSKNTENQAKEETSNNQSSDDSESVQEKPKRTSNRRKPAEDSTIEVKTDESVVLEEEPKRRGRPAKKAEQSESAHEQTNKVAEPNKAAHKPANDDAHTDEKEKKSTEPKRKGWWQKMME